MNAEIHVFQPVAWLDQALCAGRPTHWWYSDNPQHQRSALVICSQCPVRQDCLDAALLRNEVGIWGGTTQAERGAPRAAGQPRKQLVCAECREVFTRDATVGGGRMYCTKRCANRASEWRHRLGGRA